MLKKILLLISLIIPCNIVTAQDIVPLPPIPQSVDNNIKASQSNIDKSITKSSTVNKDNKAVKKIPFKIGLSKTEDHIYLSLASTICILINEHEGTSCTIKQFNDPVEAMNMMLSGDVDIVMTNSLFGKYAADGSGGFDKNVQFKKIRFISSLFDDKLMIVANRDANVKAVDDLKNISINIGQNFTKQRMFFDELIRVKQWNINDFKSTVQLNNSEQIKAICDKTVNSLIILGTDTNQYMQDTTRFCEVGFVYFTADELKLFDNDLRFIPAKIKGGLYIGMPKDIDTIAIKTILLTTSDITITQIENLLQIINKNLQKIKLLHPALKGLTLQAMLSEGKIAPLHDGVVQFMQKNNLKEEN